MANRALNDFVSARSAREDYGVKLAGTPPAVDAPATAARRQQIRAGRKSAEAPIYDWGDKLAAG